VSWSQNCSNRRYSDVLGWARKIQNSCGGSNRPGKWAWADSCFGHVCVSGQAGC
jgi:hypothetical protein